MEMPKYMTLVTWIKNKIESGELTYGEKLYSENELSTMFGISRQTVRQAINILVQDKYLESRQGSGTYVVFNASVKREPTMTIGVVTTYVGAYIFPQIIRGIEDVLTKSGYSMQLAFTHNKVQNESRVLRSMLEKGVDGMIIEPTQSGLPNPNFEIYEEIQRQRIPVLFINSSYPGIKIPHVSMNDHAAGLLATQYLIHAGHKRIAGIFKSDDHQGHLRYAGYLDALLKAGYEIHDENVLWYSTQDIPDFSKFVGIILRRIEGCTGLLCYNDEVAMQIVDMMKKNGIAVPEDLSLVSIDNSDLADLCEVPLTSVAHPMNVLGETAAQNLLHLIQDHTFKATVDFEPAIVERKSVRVLV
ncbi:GntR family transcriptional regulator [Caproiciproducens galactitolivorans]|uniref:GntR family transcriptional regulator n=1 Tax=Caproiciproducens galactitolivorans TaxID=642589 RepID=A0ABT4BUB9_9FIRM|nr:GntR family transcriptional regulator [Caproiciproducens galactitolivorans]MCY1714499.1 GntR family transcriptional regulator [Caproiciproducens galactitolivorans]